MDELQLREKLLKYKEALQPNKQPVIWRTLCETIENDFAGDIRKLFCDNDYSVQKVKLYIAKNKKKFPYLGGTKICNYWLYVMEQYTGNCGKQMAGNFEGDRFGTYRCTYTNVVVEQREI